VATIFFVLVYIASLKHATSHLTETLANPLFANVQQTGTQPFQVQNPSYWNTILFTVQGRFIQWL